MGFFGCDCDEEDMDPQECFECGSRDVGWVGHIDGFGRGGICGDCWPAFKRTRDAKRAAAAQAASPQSDPKGVE